MSKKSSPLFEEAVQAAHKLLKLLKYPRVVHFLFRNVLNHLIINKNPPWAKTLRTTFLKLGGGYINHRGLAAISYAIEAATEGNEMVLNAFKKGERLAWCDWMVTVDIVKAFGYETWNPTAAFALCVAQGPQGGAHYVAMCEEKGITDAMCSINKSSIGPVFGNEVPLPSLCIDGSHPCDNARMMNMIFEYHFDDIPSYIMDTPYGRSDEELDRWVESTWGLIEFLEKVTGRKMDWDYLEKSARNIERFNNAMNESSDLQRAVPASPLPPYMTMLWRFRLSDAGAEKLTLAAEKIRDTNRWYVEQYNKKKAPREKIRVLLGDQNLIWTDLSAWLYKNFGARIVMDYLSRSSFPPIDFSSRESLVRSLAIEKLYLSMVRQSHGTMELNVNETAAMIEEYQVDCVIYTNHVGCKHNAALKKIHTDICRKAGVPSLFLDVDIVDNRIASEEEMHSKITNFFHSHGLA
jgi:benzoyl-CoA reductase/2-hydroxyglutaryl-CoA dehydratase subunit BcrC/BadD/HgdB